MVLELSHVAPTLTATRTIEAYPGVAGFRTQMTLASPVPLLLSAVTLDEAAVGPAATPVIHAFRAGADWRGESNWTGPSAGSVGDPHAGDWRDTREGVAGRPLSAPGEWISATAGDRSFFQVLERNDFPSSRALYDGEVASTRVDWTRDIISLGPLEETGHLENPRDETVGRGRPITMAGLALPAAFTGFGIGDGDADWQFHKYLVDHRIDAYPRDVVFNSDGTDANRISTGAKDDMDYATVQEVAPLARRMGADVFTLDDGWQAASGDWDPGLARPHRPRGEVPAAVPGRDVHGRPPGDRPDEARPVDEPDELQPGRHRRTARIPTGPAARPGRASRPTRRRSPTARPTRPGSASGAPTTCPTSRRACATRSPTGTSSCSSSTSWSGWTAPAPTTSTRCTTRSSR